MAADDLPDSLLLSPRQVALAAYAEAIAVSFLLVTGSLLLFWRSSSDESTAPLIHLIGGLMVAQGAGSVLLILPLLQDCRHNNGLQKVSLQCSRAAAVSTAISGLCLVVLNVLFLTSNLEKLQCTLIATGMGLLVLSSASLMASFFPASSRQVEISSNSTLPEATNASNTAPPPQTQREATNDGAEEEEEPLLLASSNDEEEGHYSLIEDEEQETVQADTNGLNNNNDDDDELPGNSRLRGARRLLQLAAPQVLYLYAGCLVLFVRLPFSLAMPHFVSTTLAAAANGDFGAAKQEILLLFVCGTIDAALDFWGFFLFGYANQRIVRGLRVDLFRQLLGQEVAFFDAHSSGELASRLNSDCSEMAGDLTWFFRFSIESVVRITGITTYMLIRSPLLGACALSIVPFVAVINKLYGDWLSRNAVQVQDALAEANSAAQEALANVRTVIAFAAERQECQRYNTKVERQYQLNIKQLFMTAIYYMAISTFLINTVVQGSLLWIGTLLIERDKLTPGVLLAFMLYQSQLQNETLSLMNSYTSLIKSSGAGDKVFALLDRSPQQPSTGNATLTESEEISQEGQLSIEPQKSEYNIKLDHVSFRYPSRPENPVLSDLNLEIPSGTTVALVGASGCGKSTIVNLLQRFYDPSAGSIQIDGVDLRQLNLLDYRRHIGVVTQDPALFRGTLWQNITYGCVDEVPEELVYRAARLANADSFIREFVDGYDTDVGERGITLSGGQRQRVAIARAVVSNPSLILLDEATSALDAESETIVQEALDHLLQENKDMTTVIIAHRLRTVRNADKIAVLDSGRVVEQGTHDELLKADGVYRKMVERAGSNGLLPEN